MNRLVIAEFSSESFQAGLRPLFSRFEAIGLVPVQPKRCGVDFSPFFGVESGETRELIFEAPAG
jgi:hypothetical protein